MPSESYYGIRWISVSCSPALFYNVFQNLFVDASSAGRRFQLVFLENIVNYPKDGPLEVHISNPGTVAATVTVSTPMHSNSNPSETVTVNPGKFRNLNLCCRNYIQTDERKKALYRDNCRRSIISRQKQVSTLALFSMSRNKTKLFVLVN